MIQAVILAGGLGTRLRGVLAGLPKPMARIGGKPFLEYQLLALRRYGIEKSVICVGYRAQMIRDYFGDGSRWGIQIGYSIESTPLGTAGALRHAEPMLGDEFLVVNGDTFVEFDCTRLYDYHHKKGAEVTLAVKALDDREAQGNVALNPDNQIALFGEEGAPRDGSNRPWINAGVYLLKHSVLRHIPVGRAVSLEKETFPLLVTRGVSIFGYIVVGYFIDIGTPGNYFRFEKDVAEGRVHVNQE
jgi:mannose-1-phosphate guanylyltransferase